MANKQTMLQDLKKAFSLDNAILQYMMKNTPADAVKQAFNAATSYTGPKKGAPVPRVITQAKKAVKQANIPAAQSKRKASDKMRSVPNIPFRDRTKTAAKKSHNIVKGDTLSQIAKDYGTTVATLKKLNNIKDVNKIYAGRSLKLPSEAKASTKKSVPTPKSRPQLVTLKSGKKGTTAQRLKEIEAENMHKKIKKLTGK
jgi:LysM repeat protein